MWKIVGIVRNLFNLKEISGSLQQEDGQVVEEYDKGGKCRACLEHNIICG